MNLLYKVFHINTLTRKVALIIITIGTAVFVLVTLILSNVFYVSLKKYTLTTASILLKDTAAAMQDVLFANGAGAAGFADNNSLSKLLIEYYESPQRQEQVIQKIQFEKLATAVVAWDSGTYFSCSSIIISPEGDIFCKSDKQTLMKKFYSSDWYTNYRKHLAKDGNRMYSPVFSEDKGENYICYINTKAINNKLFDFIVMEEFDVFKNVFSLLKGAHINDYILLGANNEILYSNLAKSDIHLNSIPKEAFEGEQYQLFSYEMEDGADFVIRTSYRDEGLRLVAHTSKDVLISPYKPIILFIKLVLGISFAFFIIATCIVLKGSMKNLKLLSEQILKVKSGDHHVRVDIKSADEIETLGHTFNMMMDEIRDYIAKVVEHEKIQQKMQYTILISEIDPHLIYNTLNTITYLAKLKKTEDVILVNNALISMLKDRLKIKGYESFDLVRNEIEVVRQYMIIQNYLHGNSIKLRWQIETEMLEQKIPKNIIQPLVENALLHGMLAKKDEDGEIIAGEIKVSITREACWLHLFIEDSGVGISSETINKYFVGPPEISRNKGENIGIKNIRMRLNYLYDGKAEVRVDSKPGVGTIVEIIVPYEPQ